ncbi:MAG: DUF721 domain-containing protein [Armatimonadetes bacterium]|nr:DUF721 domain-containing protein [Armatimonadota bacterium]
MKKIADMVDAALGRPEIAKTGRAQIVMRDWDEVVGMGLAERCIPDRFEKGTLWVIASGSAWAQEIRLHKDLILQKLNTRAGEPLFLNLRVGTRSPRSRVSAPWENVEPME